MKKIESFEKNKHYITNEFFAKKKKKGYKPKQIGDIIT